MARKPDFASWPRTIGPLDLARRLGEDPALRRVWNALRRGESATVDGAWGGARGLVLATLSTPGPEGAQGAGGAAGDKPPPVFAIVVSRPSDVETLCEDLRTFSSHSAVVFPALDDQAADFPHEGDLAGAAATDNFGQRLAIVKTLAGSSPPLLVIASVQALCQPVPSWKAIQDASRILRRGAAVDREEFLAWLVARGWERRDAVEIPGEFSLRGGILDLFPIDSPDPLRVEWFGDEIESIREFAAASQRSLREVPEAEITALVERAAPGKPAEPAHLFDALPYGRWIALIEPNEIRAEGKQYLSRLDGPGFHFDVEETWSRSIKRPTVILSSLPYASLETTCSLRIESVERFSGNVAQVRDELDQTSADDQVLMICHNEAEVRRLGAVLAEGRAASAGRLHFAVGRLSAGFRWVSAGIVAISDHELFQRADARRLEPRRRHESRAIDSFLELREGDFTVHLAHGISIFRGMRMLDKNDQLEEHLCLEFADGALVYVPASKIDLVQKYVGSSQAPPRLSKIGGTSWERKKALVESAVRDLASDLLDVQAARQAQPGIQYPPDSQWQREFEASFPFEDTRDQAVAMVEIRGDMESTRPMDRLICGDVGYGKTELAMRAAFKSIDFGKQVAVLVPTTILAQQHYRTFKERMADFPFEIACLSRFQTRQEQKETVGRAAAGAVDILIGTHRLLSRDVQFHDLGLVIIDEEQRFGVEHKERLKQLRSQVDVLTLTATPIPRTLHSSLLGIRDISNLETPPQDRLAVETRILRFEPEMIRHAILRELNRDGQVYFVHNRIQDIGEVARRINAAVPEARVRIIHGQMHEHDIEDGMVAFLERRVDVLLATTIIESGLDIPNANTIFINEGERYGLADLHQLRGRVGRSALRAYCYILVDEHKVINPDAHRRLKAIEEFSTLGAGFKIALRDLEIRGAGNILGTQQSGHIATVGYELYCQLLENAVRALKRQPIQTFLDVTVELPWEAYLPHDYLPGERFRVDAYRRMARVRDLDVMQELRRELEDRFGPLPAPARNFLDLSEIRILAQIWQVEAVRPDDEGFLVLTYRDGRRMETLEKMRKGAVKIVDPKSAYARVDPKDRNATGYARLLKRILQPN